MVVVSCGIPGADQTLTEVLRSWKGFNMARVCVCVCVRARARARLCPVAQRDNAPTDHDRHTNPTAAIPWACRQVATNPFTSRCRGYGFASFASEQDGLGSPPARARGLLSVCRACVGSGGRMVCAQCLHVTAAAAEVVAVVAEVVMCLCFDCYGDGGMTRMATGLSVSCDRAHAYTYFCVSLNLNVLVSALVSVSVCMCICLCLRVFCVHV